MNPEAVLKEYGMVCYSNNAETCWELPGGYVYQCHYSNVARWRTRDEDGSTIAPDLFAAVEQAFECVDWVSKIIPDGLLCARTTLRCGNTPTALVCVMGQKPALFTTPEAIHLTIQWLQGNLPGEVLRDYVIDHC